MEFFCENSIDEQVYGKLILKCLELFLKPILLNKSSDALIAVENLENLFSSLGEYISFIIFVQERNIYRLAIYLRKPECSSGSLLLFLTLKKP